MRSKQHSIYNPRPLPIYKYSTRIIKTCLESQAPTKLFPSNSLSSFRFLLCSANFAQRKRKKYSNRPEIPLCSQFIDFISIGGFSQVPVDSNAVLNHENIWKPNTKRSELISGGYHHSLANLCRQQTPTDCLPDWLFAWSLVLITVSTRQLNVSIAETDKLQIGCPFADSLNWPSLQWEYNIIRGFMSTRDSSDAVPMPFRCLDVYNHLWPFDLFQDPIEYLNGILPPSTTTHAPTCQLATSSWGWHWQGEIVPSRRLVFIAQPWNEGKRTEDNDRKKELVKMSISLFLFISPPDEKTNCSVI